MVPRALLAVALLLLLPSCASTKVETTGAKMQQPFCNAGGEKLSALVYWGPQWRPDQKEPERREAAAVRGIESFFSDSACVARFDVRRLPGERMAEVPSDEALLKLAAAASPRPDKALVVVVRELGPILRIGIPSIVEGALVERRHLRGEGRRVARAGHERCARRCLDARSGSAVNATCHPFNPRRGGQ
jgi:hypothetical protein